jgi:aryl-alcohol dehydrogenase-like predicted oxidoreductase
MSFGSFCDRKTSFAIMDKAYERGINFFDTAELYPVPPRASWAGETERIVGEWLQTKPRDSVILATKVAGAASGWFVPPIRHGLTAIDRFHIERAVEGSLKRLNTDYIDLYQMHWPDSVVPVEESLEAFDRLVRSGKVRYIGASNISAWRLMKSLCISDRHDLARYHSLQPHYNLVHRNEFESEVKPLCESEQIGVIPYSPLAGGFLTGKYHLDSPPPDSARQESVKRRYFNEYGWRVLAAVERIADDRGVQPLQVSLAWLLNQKVITAPIIGANSIEQLLPSLEATDIHLSDEEMRILDEASRTENKA